MTKQQIIEQIAQQATVPVNDQTQLLIERNLNNIFMVLDCYKRSLTTEIITE